MIPSDLDRLMQTPPQRPATLAERVKQRTLAIPDKIGGLVLEHFTYAKAGDTKEILVKNSSIEVRRKAFTKATALAVGGLALATIVGANLNQDDQKAPITPKQTIEQSVAVIETEWAE